MAKIIMLIRHAEKPDDTQQGVDESGRQDKESLSVIGWQRAGALAAMLAPQRNPGQQTTLVTPTHLFATKLNPELGDHSKRPQQTLAPLARLLAADVNTQYGSGDEDLLIQKAMEFAGPALICWRHVSIPKIAHLLLKHPYLKSAPWPEDRFDMVLVFNSTLSDSI